MLYCWYSSSNINSSNNSNNSNASNNSNNNNIINNISNNDNSNNDNDNNNNDNNNNNNKNKNNKRNDKNNNNNKSISTSNDNRNINNTKKYSFEESDITKRLQNELNKTVVHQLLEKYKSNLHKKEILPKNLQYQLSKYRLPNTMFNDLLTSSQAGNLTKHISVWRGNQ